MSRRDVPLGFVELGLSAITWHRAHRHRGWARPIADLCLCAEEAMGDVSAYVVHILYDASVPSKFVGRADDDGIILRLDGENVERLWGGDVQALSLADGIGSQATVLAQQVPSGVENRSGSHDVRCLFGQELAIVASLEETDILALGVLRDRQVVLTSDSANLILRQPAQREARVGQLFLGQGVKEVRLVFAGITSTQESIDAVDLLNSGVVAGGQRVGAQCQSPLLQETETDETVAPHARVRGSAGGVLGDEVVDNISLECFLGLNQVKRYAELTADAASPLDGSWSGYSRPLPPGLEL